MSRVERKTSSITPLIKSIKAFSEVQTNEGDLVLPDDIKIKKGVEKQARFIHGSFVYNEETYHFMDCTSPIMGLHQISASFNYKITKKCDKLVVLEIANKLNEMRVGIKTQIESFKPSLVEVKFSTEILSVGEEITKDKIIVLLNILSSSSDVFWEMISDIKDS